MVLPGGEPMTVPQTVGDVDSLLRDRGLPEDVNVYNGDDPLTIPSWGPAAWTVLGHDPQLREAVSAIYEAMSLEMDHPSAAYLLHVAALDGLGKGRATGSRARFMAALATALTAEEVQDLAGAYERRCETGHQGSLHGAETTFGIGGWSLFQQDPKAQFEIVDTTAICNASRKVVVTAIKEAAERVTAAPP
jgi:hypothetical protein